MVRVGARLQAALDARALSAALNRLAMAPQEIATLSAQRDLDALARFWASPVLLALLDAPWTPIFIAALFVCHPWLDWFAVVAGLALLMFSLANQRMTERPLHDATIATLSGDRHGHILKAVLPRSTANFAFSPPAAPPWTKSAANWPATSRRCRHRATGSPPSARRLIPSLPRSPRNWPFRNRCGPRASCHRSLSWRCDATQRQEEATADLREIGPMMLELSETRRAMRDRVSRLEVRAPASGIVLGLQIPAAIRSARGRADPGPGPAAPAAGWDCADHTVADRGGHSGSICRPRLVRIPRIGHDTPGRPGGTDLGGCAGRAADGRASLVRV